MRNTHAPGFLRWRIQKRFFCIDLGIAQVLLFEPIVVIRTDTDSDIKIHLISTSDE